jgi:transposase
MFVAVNEKGHAGEAIRVEHDRRLYREFLSQLPEQSPIAIEASGHYGWLVDEMEQLGHCPKLANPLEARRRAKTKKTDKLDATGNRSLRRGSTIATGRAATRVANHSRETVVDELAVLDFLEVQIEATEQRLQVIMAAGPEADLLKTLPCVGKILSMILMLEIGKVECFPTAAHLASYAGLVPRLHSSGGHTRMGQVCGNVDRNLKWAFVEAGNLVVINQRRLAGSHIVRLYQRIRRSKNHQKAVVAVARHLADASYWVLTRQEVYREPRLARPVPSSTHG